MTGKASNPPDDGMARVRCDDLDATRAGLEVTLLGDIEDALSSIRLALAAAVHTPGALEHRGRDDSLRRGLQLPH